MSFDISKGASTRFHLNILLLSPVTQLHGDASFAHSSGVVFMKSFHKWLAPSATLSACSDSITRSVNAFSFPMHCTTF